jgi:hypothetical protein
MKTERYILTVYMGSSDRTSVTIDGATDAAAKCAAWLKQDWRCGHPICVYDDRTRSNDPMVARLGGASGHGDDFHATHTRGARAFAAAFGKLTTLPRVL